MNKIIKLTTCTTILVLAGCASQQADYQKTLQDFQQYEQQSDKTHFDKKWWVIYQDPQLNKVMQTALSNNINLAKAAISVNRALYQANLLGADLVPAFSGSTTSSASKSLKDNSANSTISHTGQIGITYTLDLWRKLADSADAAEWEHAATIQDLESTKLTLISNVIDGYLNWQYLQNAIQLEESMVKNYQQIKTIVARQVKYGTSNRINLDQAISSLRSAQNSLASYKLQLVNAEQTLRNLLNLKPNQPLWIKKISLSKLSHSTINMNIPLSAIGQRPDLRAYQYRLSEAFKDLKAMEKSWYPSITLSGTLSSSGDKVSNAFNLPFLAGNVGITLPFLDWQTVHWNVKTSEADYNTAKLNFEQGITTALNDVYYQYQRYQKSQQSYKLLQQENMADKRVANYYRNRYNNGVEEMKDWLSAINSENSSRLSMLEAQYTLLSSENSLYASMGGRYIP